MRRSVRKGVAASMAMLFVGLPIAADEGTAVAAEPVIVSLGIMGYPFPIDDPPPGVGLFYGAEDSARPDTWQRRADGSVANLGHVTKPLFFLGQGDDAMLVALASEADFGDLNRDGDQQDLVLATSANGSPFAPTIDGPVFPGGTGGCLIKLNDELAVACMSETVAGVDANHDGDRIDVEIVLIHATGVVERTGTFIDEISGTVRQRGATRLPDGSVLIGPVRVFPDGTTSTEATTSPALADGLIVGTVGSSRLISVQVGMGLYEYYLVPEGGAPVRISLNHIIQVGTSLWVWTTGGDVCRLFEDGTKQCLGIKTYFMSQGPVIPLGEDAALVIGYRGLTSTAGGLRSFLVRAGELPIDLGRGQPGVLTDLDDHSLLLIAHPGPPQRLLYVTATGSTQVDLPAEATAALSLDDGRALVQMKEKAGLDLNHDGDTSDLITHLFADGGWTNLGVTVDLHVNYGSYPTAIALPDRGPILLTVDEATDGDRNGDGDINDMVAAWYDGTKR